MRSIAGPDCARLAPLFADRSTLLAVVESVLEGHLGHADVDDAANPQVARLSVGCYAIFGGDAGRPAARALLSSVERPRELLFPAREDWRRRIREVHGELPDRTMRTFDASRLKIDELRRQAETLPVGFRLSRLDAPLAGRLGPEHQPNAMQVFTTAEDLAARGCGVCALHEEEIACVATSYTFSERRIELSIATHPGFRRRGLARAVAAALMANCLERGVAPEWSAANPVSQRLAESLGYLPADLCEVLYRDAR